MLASNIKQIFIAIGLVLIASLIYVFGTSMIFFSSGNHLELSYLLAIICFMPLGFIVIPHLIAQKILSTLANTIFTLVGSLTC